MVGSKEASLHPVSSSVCAYPVRTAGDVSQPSVANARTDARNHVLRSRARHLQPGATGRLGNSQAYLVGPSPYENMPHRHLCAGSRILHGHQALSIRLCDQQNKKNSPRSHYYACLLQFLLISPYNRWTGISLPCRVDSTTGHCRLHLSSLCSPCKGGPAMRWLIGVGSRSRACMPTSSQ